MTEEDIYRNAFYLIRIGAETIFGSCMQNSVLEYYLHFHRRTRNITKVNTVFPFIYYIHCFTRSQNSDPMALRIVGLNENARWRTGLLPALFQLGVFLQI